MYAEPKGVPQDYAAAVNWLSKAADQGQPNAQFLLGAMYVDGNGLPQDFVTAHMWLNLAAARLSPGGFRDEAAKIRDLIADAMPPDQIAEAQRLAREWNPKTE